MHLCPSPVASNKKHSTLVEVTIQCTHFTEMSPNPSFHRTALKAAQAGEANVGQYEMETLNGADLLVERFHRYFHHPDPFHDYLTRGDRATACDNVRDALAYIDISEHGLRPKDPELFDEELFQLVRKFQRDYHHSIVDGKVGPNTRRRLISTVLRRHGPSVFNRLRKDDVDKIPSVFLSYAWADTDKVDKVDQWLRNHGVRVLRDLDIFVAGSTIDENIRSAVARSDRIIVFYSKSSKDRDWPRLERSIAEEVEGVSTREYWSTLPSTRHRCQRTMPIE
jgi:hypothetical protein